MDIGLQNKIFKEHSSLFVYEDNFETLNFIECNDGWFDIIKTLLETIDNYVEYNLSENRPYITDISEKNGLLRVYVSNSDKVIDGMIFFAEAMSGKICELTGEMGDTYFKGGISKTLSPLKARELGFIP
jgi:hypothetical protein